MAAPSNALGISAAEGRSVKEYEPSVRKMILLA
jgi:hypothetical protein